MKGAAYAHDLDYDTRLAYSSSTYGAYVTASVPAGPLKLNGRLEYATQSDNGANPVD